MLYLNEKDLLKIGIRWNETIDNLEKAVACLDKKDYAQPVKPYLRYREPVNRIIAMPAFVGGDINLAGIKWIASFPGNIDHGLPRAHSVVVLNQAETGVPVAVINTALLSIVRTASVSGMMIRHFLKARPLQKANVSILGWGPIGRYHYKMVSELMKGQINKISLFDIRGVDPKTIDGPAKDQTVVVNSWQEAYADADIFITCTVSKAPYVDQKPKAGSLQLNCSLRDYKTSILDFTKAIIVDDWEEVCREKTDIEMMHKERGLQEKDTKNIADVVYHNAMAAWPKEMPIMFNPMGMAVFDIATGRYFIEKAKALKVGLELE